MRCEKDTNFNCCAQIESQGQPQADQHTITCIFITTMLKTWLKTCTKATPTFKKGAGVRWV